MEENKLLWYVCKFCQRAFPCSQTDRFFAHKQENHAKELRREKREKRRFLKGTGNCSELLKPEPGSDRKLAEDLNKIDALPVPANNSNRSLDIQPKNPPIEGATSEKSENEQERNRDCLMSKDGCEASEIRYEAVSTQEDLGGNKTEDAEDCASAVGTSSDHEESSNYVLASIYVQELISQLPLSELNELNELKSQDCVNVENDFESELQSCPEDNMNIENVDPGICLTDPELSFQVQGYDNLFHVIPAFGKDCSEAGSDEILLEETADIQTSENSAKPETQNLANKNVSEENAEMVAITGERPLLERPDLSVNPETVEISIQILAPKKISMPKNPATSNFECTICSKGFKTLGGLKLHKIGRCNQSKVTQPCQCFPKTGKSRSKVLWKLLKLAKLLQIALLKKRKSYRCKHCLKIFKMKKYSKDLIQAHINAHKDRKPYLCSLCSKPFGSPWGLQRHRKTHTSRRSKLKLSCSSCSRTFSTYWAHSAHENLNKLENPETCSSCTLSFRRKCEFKAHARTHEEVHKRSNPAISRPSAHARKGKLEDQDSPSRNEKLRRSMRQKGAGLGKAVLKKQVQKRQKSPRKLEGAGVGTRSLSANAKDIIEQELPEWQDFQGRNSDEEDNPARIKHERRHVSKNSSQFRKEAFSNSRVLRSAATGFKSRASSK